MDVAANTLARFGAIVEENDIDSAIQHVLTCKQASIEAPPTLALPASMAPPDAKSIPPGTAL